MDVSHFELIWKPQSPNAPTGSAAVDRVLQGYFLEITNLEAVEYTYAVDFVAAPVSDPLRSLAGNTVVFVDTPGSNNAPGFLQGGLADTVFRPSNGSVTIPPNGTALVVLLPSAFGPLPFDPTPLTTPNFEVRGHVRLRLPPVFRQTPSAFGPLFRLQAQAAAPVKVLLTPQNRTTYFLANGTISDQTQASLPLASGAALNLLPPEQPFRFTLPVAVDLDIIRRLERAIPAQDMPMMMQAMLATIDPETTDLAAMNDSLAKAGIGLALERRKMK